MKVGLPRALLYHRYGESWAEFLQALDIEPILTRATAGKTVLAGAEVADNETCLPVKVFTGHLLELRDRVDAILVPCIVSQRPGMVACPQYIGMSSLATVLDCDLPPMLTPMVNLADRRNRWTEDWRSLAVRLGAGDHVASYAVARMLQGLGKADPLTAAPAKDGILIGVAGHSYTLMDGRASLGIIDLVKSFGAGVVTVDRLPRKCIARQLETLDRKIRWDFESSIVGGVLHWSRTASVDGIIYASSFACGPGSMIGALLDDQLGREVSVPFMEITLDEHSAEGGLVTRVEAFMDMLSRRGLESRTSGIRPPVS
jgi:predicted nucleotide-binding protein (sugar kinase/HSP70/actin superfamily)